ncbi:metallophosphoesterase [candidate division KSB1 bacterium]
MHDRVLISGLLLLLVQFYIFYKCRRYIKDVFPKKLWIFGYFLLFLFFVWVNFHFIHISSYGIWTEPPSKLHLYGFAYPFYAWTTSLVFITLLFLLKDITYLIWKSGKFLLRISLKIFGKSFFTEKSSSFDPSKRKLLRTLSSGVVLVPFGMSYYGLIFSSRDYYINKMEMHFPNLPENLRGLKIAQMSDIHCSIHTTKEDILNAVKIINEESCDLILLTGDYIPDEMEFIHPCAEAFSKLKAKHGVFSTLGNHEIWRGSDPVFITKVLEENGIPVFRNTGKTLDINGEKLNLLGVDDSRWGRADIEKALNMVESGNFNILMSHQPPYWDRAVDRGIDLTLAGHTHGGQIEVSLAGIQFGPGQLFSRYNKGLYSNGDSKLFVSTGIGYTGPPIRYNIPPEIVIITLT